MRRRNWTVPSCFVNTYYPYVGASTIVFIVSAWYLHWETL